MTLPITGMEARLILSKIEKEFKTYQRIMDRIKKTTKDAANSIGKSGKDIARTFDELADKSKHLGRASLVELVSLSRAFSKVEGKAAVNVKTFDELLASGKGLSEAFVGAAVGATSLTAVLGSIAAASAAVVTGIGAVVGTMGVAIKIADDLADAYRDYTFEVRRLKIEMGITTGEASRLLAASKALGVSADSVSRAYVNLGKKISDEQARLIEGTDETTEFTRALDRLGVTVVDREGNFRSISDIITDVETALANISSQTERSALANSIWGRSFREVLPLLEANKDDLKDFNDFLIKHGLSLREDIIPKTEKYALAQAKLDAASLALKNSMADLLLPALTDVSDTLATMVANTRDFLLIAGVLVSTIDAVSSLDTEPIAKLTAGVGIFLAGIEGIKPGTIKARENIERLANETAEAAEAAEKLAQAYRNVLRAAGEALAESVARTEELGRRFDEQLEDLERRRGRQVEDEIRRNQQRREDLERSFNNRIADIIADWNDRRAEQDRKNAKRRQDLEDDASKKREKILARHLERMFQIRQRFSDDASEAARRRDAIAFLRAQRQRNRDLRDERRRFGIEQRDLERDLADRRRKLDEAIAEEKRQDEKRLADALARAQRSHERQLEALKRSISRQQEERKIGWRREEEDLDISRRRQLASLTRWFTEETNALKLHLDDRMRLWLAFYQRRSSLYGGTPTRRGNVTLPRGRLSRQSGGVDFVNRPTSFAFGEGNTPEMIVSVPLNRTMHHTHTFGRLDGRIDGVSQMNEQQVMGLITMVLTEFARSL